MAGYSAKPLWQKLGMKEEATHVIINMPKDYPALLKAGEYKIALCANVFPNAHFIQLFTSSRMELEQIFPELISALASRGMIWISWPKKSAKVVTDLDENIIREIGLALGIVDVKVCAIDEVWSGLKFLRRKNK
ncbi:MAG: DUF3052 domain-containing protein [Candidatus Abawacabacteria bacterium]|nr:DUF3052 domain-containing protein [Candidatus Abawacabacteria bacterium]